MIEKSKDYIEEIRRVKNKVNSYLVQQLREKRSKDPKTYWNIIKGD